MASDTPESGAFFRELMAQWEKFSGGGEKPKPEDFARMVFGATTAAGNAQAALKGMAERAMGAANIPTRIEIEELSARIGRVEAALFRIEARLAEIAPGGDPARG